jgi:CheY-like chemotaxis protein
VCFVSGLTVCLVSDLITITVIITLQDSAVCRRMLGKVLQSLSITYEEAEDGVQAIEKVQLSLLPEQKDQPNVRRFDLILVSVIEM